MTEYFDLTKEYNSLKLEGLRKEILGFIFNNPEYKLGPKNTVEVELDHTVTRDGMRFRSLTYKVRGTNRKASTLVWDSLREILDKHHADQDGVEKVFIEIHAKGRTLITAEMTDEYIKQKVELLASDIKKYKDTITVVTSLMSLFAMGAQNQESKDSFLNLLSMSPISPDSKLVAHSSDGTDVEMESIREIMERSVGSNDILGLKNEWYRFVQSFLIVKIVDEMTKLGIFKAKEKRPLFEFMRHLRNSQAHGGVWHFTNEEPKHEATFKTFNLDSSMHGEDPRKFIGDGDVLELFDELSKELASFANVYHIIRGRREAVAASEIEGLKWGGKVNLPINGVMHEVTLDQDGRLGKDMGKGTISMWGDVYFIQSYEAIGKYDPKHYKVEGL